MYGTRPLVPVLLGDGPRGRSAFVQRYVRLPLASIARRFCRCNQENRPDTPRYPAAPPRRHRAGSQRGPSCATRRAAWPKKYPHPKMAVPHSHFNPIGQTGVPMRAVRMALVRPGALAPPPVGTGRRMLQRADAAPFKHRYAIASAQRFGFPDGEFAAPAALGNLRVGMAHPAASGRYGACHQDTPARPSRGATPTSWPSPQPGGPGLAHCRQRSS